MKRTYIIALTSLLSCLPGYPATVRTATETFVTNKIAAAVAAIPSPDYSTNNTELVETIQTTAPAPDLSGYLPKRGGILTGSLQIKTDADEMLDLYNDDPYLFGRVTVDWLIHEDGPSTLSLWDRFRNIHYDFPTNGGTVAMLENFPTKVSAFTNDAGYLTAYTETDPTVPQWAKAQTKPTYSLNDVCPDTENWLGRPGTTAAGKSIKVLAKTVNGVIEGGLTVSGSSNNDNNTTKYRYNGVTATRNGTATDYLFDTSSQSGIVRRSELASLAPGDYANVSNRAVHALGNTGDQTLSGGRLTIDHNGPDGDVWLQTKRGLQSGLALCFDGLLLDGNYYTLPLSSGRLALESQIPSGDDWTATNTVAVIARHTGKETVSIPSGGNLVADLSGWNDGVQTFVVLQPSGAYTVASNVEYCGYGTWPTNTALCVAWPYAGTLYVNPITIVRE